MKIELTYGACFSVAILLLTSTAFAQEREPLENFRSQDRSAFELQTRKAQHRMEEDLRRAAQRERKDLIDQVRGANNQEQFDSFRDNLNPTTANRNTQWSQHMSLTESVDRTPSNLGAFANSSNTYNRLSHFPSHRDSMLMKINNQYSEAISQLVAEIKESEDDEQKKKLKGQLGEMLSKQYDAYLDHHEEPLKQLEARLEKLREEFESRKSAKADLVKLRLDSIWYDAIGLGWPGNSGNNSLFNSPRFNSVGPQFQQQDNYKPYNPNLQVPSAVQPVVPRPTRQPDALRARPKARKPAIEPNGDEELPLEEDLDELNDSRSGR